MRRAIGLSIQTLVVIVLAVIVLVSIVLLYTGQTAGLFAQIAEIGGSTEGASEAAVAGVEAIGQ